jgi:hypothetical protein
MSIFMMIFLLWRFYALSEFYLRLQLLYIQYWFHSNDYIINSLCGTNEEFNLFPIVALWLYFLLVPGSESRAIDIIYNFYILIDNYSSYFFCTQKVNNHQTFAMASHLLQEIVILQRSRSIKKLSQVPLPGHLLHQDDQEHRNQRLRSARASQHQLLWRSRFKTRN